MNVGNGSNPHDTAVKWAWQGIGKQFHYWVLFLLFSLSCLLAGRTLAVEIEYSGALVNLTDLSGSFPIGSPFTLSMDVDEMVADTSEEADRGFYPGCIRAVELSLADSGFSLAGSPGEENEWEIRPGASLGEPASRAFCPITDGDGRMLEIEVRAYPKAGQPLGTKALAGGFEEGNFRLVEVIVYEVKTDPVLRATYRVTYGFGWVMANAPGRSATGPEPLASDGVGFEFMAVLGDSLSASRQERNSTTRSPETTSMVAIPTVRYGSSFFRGPLEFHTGSL